MNKGELARVTPVLDQGTVRVCRPVSPFYTLTVDLPMTTVIGVVLWSLPK